MVESRKGNSERRRPKRMYLHGKRRLRASPPAHRSGRVRSRPAASLHFSVVLLQHEVLDLLRCEAALEAVGGGGGSQLMALEARLVGTPASRARSVPFRLGRKKLVKLPEGSPAGGIGGGHMRRAKCEETYTQKEAQRERMKDASPHLAVRRTAESASASAWEK